MKFPILLLTLTICGVLFAQQAPPASTQASPAAQGPSPTTPPSSSVQPPFTPDSEPPASSDVGASGQTIGSQAHASAPQNPADLARFILAGVSEKDVPALQKRAASNDRIAQMKLGYAYATGTAVPRDLGAAMEWLTKAADKGSGAAALLLGMLYGGGGVLPADYPQAEKWLLIARDADLPLSAEMLTKLQQLAPPDQVNAGEKQARAWLGAHVAFDDRPVSQRTYHVGGSVKPPKAVYTPDPAYPELERSAGREGTVVLWLIVDESGKPRTIKVSRSAGHDFDENAIEAVSRWHFKPAENDGRPVAVQINVEVSFHLWRR